MTYSMVCHLFHIFHLDIIRENARNEIIPLFFFLFFFVFFFVVFFSHDFRLPEWSTLKGTLALRGKTLVCSKEIPENKHHCAVHLFKN